MNVLFLCRLFAPHIGGVETHVLKIARALQSNGHHITVVTEQFESELPIEEVSEGITVIRVPQSLLTKKTTLWKWMWSHRSLFQHADVVHVHDIFWWVVPVLPFIKKKYFITFHGWEGTFPPKKMAILQRKAAAKLAKGVIHIGEYIHRWYGTRADLTIYGAVDADLRPNLFQNGKQMIEKIVKLFQKKEMISKQEYEYDAVFIGRLSQDNDVEKVIKLFSLWKQKKSDLKLLFIGDGEVAEKCQKVAKVTGFVTNVAEYVAKSKIVFASSYLSIMEAQAQGRLVCSFYSNPLKLDYFKYYPQVKAMRVSDEPEEMLMMIEHSLRYFKETRLKLEQAQAWVLQQTWENVANEYEKLWEKK
jgi:glycosyltransferase involved in cell wall biosynthesis